MVFLGWYSLVILVLSQLINIADNKQNGVAKAVSLILGVPIIIYIILNLF